MKIVTFYSVYSGKALLVHPVTDKDVSSVSVYLPKGVWYDFYTYQPYSGGSHSIPVNDDTVSASILINALLISKYSK